MTLATRYGITLWTMCRLWSSHMKRDGCVCLVNVPAGRYGQEQAYTGFAGGYVDMIRAGWDPTLTTASTPQSHAQQHGEHR